jgi:hypothetical protein
MVKALAAADISFDCFEASDDIGGNWHIGNKNGMSSAYESLRINTTRELMQYADFPMSADYPDYPNHRQIKAYFDDYMAAFSLREHVSFNSTVNNVRRSDDGRWEVQVNDESPRYYHHVVVANGHHWDPRWPDPAHPGDFDGMIMHSHRYLSPWDPVDMEGKRVVVVGMGNSAVDIACELADKNITERVYLSARETSWVLPKYLWGVPVASKMPPRLPWRLQSLLMRGVLKLATGSPRRHGLPKPAYPLLATHPTISQHLFDKLDTGDITYKPGIESLQGTHIHFTDGTRVAADVLIYCTGYNVSFPFFDPAFISAPENKLPLWMRLCKPGEDGLYFLGRLQPLGAIMPIAEQQARFVCDLVAGKARLPDVQTMEAAIASDESALSKRYKASSRHTMQVDAADYLYHLEKAHRSAQQAV